MRLGDYGLSIRSNTVDKFTSSIEEQVHLLWAMMWASSDISGKKRISINYHGDTLAYGTVSFDLPAREVIVKFTYLSDKMSEHRDVFDIKKEISLTGLCNTFTIVLLQDR